MQPQFPVLAAVLALALVVPLAGCGAKPKVTEAPISVASSPTATPTPSSTPSALLPSAYLVWSEAQKVLAGAASLHLVWTSTDSSGAMTLDVSGTRDGLNTRQVMSGRMNSETRVVDGRIYLRGDRAFLKDAGMTDDSITRLGGRFASVTVAAVETAGLTPQDLSFASWLDEVKPLTINLASASFTIEKTELAGVPAFLVTETQTGETHKLWVTATASHTPLKATSVVGTESLEMTFSEWDAVAPIAAPPASQVLKL